jgi:AAA+ superfamily predicted ATPase
LLIDILESIAAFSRRPLFPLGSGALGTTGGEIEAQLNRCLALATRWNALVLIDEADIFMESRGRDDLQRNNVVSGRAFFSNPSLQESNRILVFLRTLEYFNGIMFLTTNRVESIDPAFKSRIHLSITYPALDMDARAKLWTAFISKAYGDKRPSWLDEAFREKLSNAEVNGRQIKNIIRTAYSLAMKKHRKIRPKDLMLALKALQSFEEDFSNAAATRNYAEETSPRTKKRKREE